MIGAELTTTGTRSVASREWSKAVESVYDRTSQGTREGGSRLARTWTYSKDSNHRSRVHRCERSSTWGERVGWDAGPVEREHRGYNLRDPLLGRAG